jgi:uncharacterized protein
VRIAIIGSGISGLTCAHILRREHDVHLFEADRRLGGHTNTVRVELPEGPIDVDTGFIVHNERNYPNFCRLLGELGIATQPSDMSFGVSDAASGLEYRATSLDTLLARRSNALRPDLWRLLADIVRFHRRARRFLEQPDASLTVGDWLARYRWSPAFRELFFVPLVAAIWSAEPDMVAQQPASFLLSFLRNHGLLGLRQIPEWRTVTGGAARYVDAIAAPLFAANRIHTATPVHRILRGVDHVEVDAGGDRPLRFDRVVLATHSDQALDLLADATPAEKEVLGAIPYQPNRAVLHTDARAMPRSRRAWASWNYHRPLEGDGGATLTYDLNRLQALRTSEPILLTLNRDDAVDPARVIAAFEYSHPVFTLEGLAAQQRHAEIDGSNRTHFCGAYWGHGFHEDGVRSALAVCAKLASPW